MKLFFFTLILYSLTAQAFTVPAFNGKLANNTGYDISDLRITVEMYCSENMTGRICGEDIKRVKFNQDGSFTVPELNHDGSIYQYYVFSYTIEIYNHPHNLAYSVIIDCVGSRTHEYSSECGRDKLTKTLKEISLYLNPSYTITPVLSNGWDFDWFLQNRTSTGWESYDIELFYRGQIYDLEKSTFLKHIRKASHTTTSNIIALPGLHDLNAEWDIQLMIHEPWSPGFSLRKMMTFSDIPQYMSAPLVQIDESNYYLNGVVSFAVYEGVYSSFDYSGIFKCENNILTGNIVKLKRIDWRTESEPIPGSEQNIVGECAENTAKFEFVHNERNIFISVTSVINEAAEYHEASDFRKIDKVVFRKKGH